jgi:hypothetical protein
MPLEEVEEEENSIDRAKRSTRKSRASEQEQGDSRKNDAATAAVGVTQGPLPATRQSGRHNAVGFRSRIHGGANCRHCKTQNVEHTTFESQERPRLRV